MEHNTDHSELLTIVTHDHATRSQTRLTSSTQSTGIQDNRKSHSQPTTSARHNRNKANSILSRETLNNSLFNRNQKETMETDPIISSEDDISITEQNMDEELLTDTTAAAPKPKSGSKTLKSIVLVPRTIPTQTTEIRKVNPNALVKIRAEIAYEVELALLQKYSVDLDNCTVSQVTQLLGGTDFNSQHSDTSSKHQEVDLKSLQQVYFNKPKPAHDFEVPEGQCLISQEEMALFELWKKDKKGDLQSIISSNLNKLPNSSSIDKKQVTEHFIESKDSLRKALYYLGHNNFYGQKITFSKDWDPGDVKPITDWIERSCNMITKLFTGVGPEYEQMLISKPKNRRNESAPATPKKSVQFVTETSSQPDNELYSSVQFLQRSVDGMQKEIKDMHRDLKENMRNTTQIGYNVITRDERKPHKPKPLSQSTRTSEVAEPDHGQTRQEEEILFHFVIMSKDPRTFSSWEVMHEVLKQLDPKKHGAKRVRRTQRGVAFDCPTLQIRNELYKAALNDNRLTHYCKIYIPNTLFPTIEVRNVPMLLSTAQLIKSITADQKQFSGHHDNFIAGKKEREKKTSHDRRTIHLYIKPPLWQRLKEENFKIKTDFGTLSAKEIIMVRQCRDCLSFEHYAFECPDKDNLHFDVTCPTCAERYPRGSPHKCTRGLCCATCKGYSNSIPTYHRANSTQCPKYKKLLLIRKRYIAYTAEQADTPTTSTDNLSPLEFSQQDEILTPHTRTLPSTSSEIPQQEVPASPTCILSSPPSEISQEKEIPTAFICTMPPSLSELSHE